MKIKPTGKSSEHFGKCDLCKTHVSETFSLQVSPTSLHKYGHKKCLDFYKKIYQVKT
jgi:hypothetical protein